MSSMGGTHMEIEQTNSPAMLEMKPEEIAQADHNITEQTDLKHHSGPRDDTSKGQTGSHENRSHKDSEEHEHGKTNDGHGEHRIHMPHLPHVNFHNLLRHHQDHPILTSEIKKELFEEVFESNGVMGDERPM
ncbi:hypothetical protein RRG08_021823 [Elysia crispata]|uniref:Uncharacterized protein n=1 Tax=Elysia crispata TaxID=231223 RepID=A0AAE0ZXV6_9GAST|nr:hypothetical protein RRG08_021823 [Elysia crispata]